MSLLNLEAIQQHKSAKPISAEEKQSIKLGEKISGIGKPGEQLKKHIGTIGQNETIDFWTNGRWSMHDLIFHLLKQTGPAHVQIATWSISETAVRLFKKGLDDGLFLSLRFLIDKRVKVRKPQALQMIYNNFDYRMISIHAKVTLIENENYKLTIISSANCTNNPREEVGIISTIPERYDFHKARIDHEFKQ